MRVSALAQATAGLALLALSACQDPSTVGVGLIDDEFSNPNVVVLPAGDAVPSTYPVTTSGFATAASQSRVLVGDVRDALFGDATADATVDAVAPALPDGFADRPVTRVTLELRRDYAYGDTTAAVPVELRQVVGSWSPTGLPSDTTLGTGDVITTATLNPTDTLSVIPLPTDWVTANGALFGKSSFGTDFEGFQLRPAGTPGDGVVLGYNVAATTSVIRVATARDTVAFRLSEVYTHLTRTPAAAVAGRSLLRAGSGDGIRLAFDYTEALRRPLAQAVFRIPLDRSLAGATGPFKRPLATEAAVFARTSDTVENLAALLTIGKAGDARSQATTASIAVFTQFVQQILLDQATYENFELRLVENPISLDVLPVVTDGAVPTARPRLSLTVVGQ